MGVHCTSNHGTRRRSDGRSELIETVCLVSRLLRLSDGEHYCEAIVPADAHVIEGRDEAGEYVELGLYCTVQLLAWERRPSSKWVNSSPVPARAPLC